MISSSGKVLEYHGKKLYEKRLTGLEEELAALYETLDEYAHRMQGHSKTRHADTERGAVTDVTMFPPLPSADTIR